MKQFFFLISLLLCFLFLCFLPSRSQKLIEQELSTQQVTLSTVSQVSYNVQKYVGFNFLVDFFAEAIIKTVIKLKIKAEDVSIDLQTYSGLDFLRKKAKALNIKAHNLFIKDIPISYFELSTKDPIWVKKNTEKKNRVVTLLKIVSCIKINIDDVNKVLNSLPKWQKVLGELELPIPPFGRTEIKLKDLLIKIDDKGFIQVDSNVVSSANQAACPLKLLFSGNLALVENKIVVNDLKSEVKDIFTKDSDMEKSFSKFLEELINPIFDFHKYEKNGLTIDFIKLTFDANNLILEVSIKLLPEESDKR